MRPILLICLAACWLLWLPDRDWLGTFDYPDPVEHYTGELEVMGYTDVKMAGEKGGCIYLSAKKDGETWGLKLSPPASQ